MRAIDQSRRGAAYIAVLITVLSVVILVLTGAALRRSTLGVSHAHADAVRATTAADAGIRYAEHLVLNPDELEGVVSGSTVLSQSTSAFDVDVTLEDPQTGAATTYDASSVRVVAVGRAGETRRTMSFEYLGASEYQIAGESMGALSYWPLSDPKGSTEFTDTLLGVTTAYKNGGQAGHETHSDGFEAPRFLTESAILEVDHDGVYEADEISIALWVRWDAGGDRFQGVISKETAGFSYIPQHALYFDDGDLVHVVSVLGSTRSAEVDEEYFNDEDWHFVVVTVGTGDRLCIYVDGVLRARESNVWIGLAHGGFVNTFPWTIGGRRDDNAKPGYLDDNLDGSVARVMFFPSQISADDVSTLYKSSTVPSEYEIVQGSWRSGS